MINRRSSTSAQLRTQQLEPQCIFKDTIIIKTTKSGLVKCKNFRSVNQFSLKMERLVLQRKQWPRALPKNSLTMLKVNLLKVQKKLLTKCNQEKCLLKPVQAVVLPLKMIKQNPLVKYRERQPLTNLIVNTSLLIKLPLLRKEL